MKNFLKDLWNSLVDPYDYGTWANDILIGLLTGGSICFFVYIVIRSAQ